ncbi:hypothetical protein P43SY_010546 [Pythium insidiosum]|uniref:Uncharacterized protein n=1 Tax=Pythium insidiosum TaxID=114742 RepID=A0AAD5L896_PYTIN|nr:hypothetical protein P43SY_010546 [Pythium insidiosum]
MLELKAFVQETVHALEDTQLRLLSETLRVDVRGCDNRADIERIVTGLLCLDQDTSLGTFLTWLRTRDTSRSSLVAKKTTFANTFVPTVSPRRGAASPPRSPAPHQLEPSAPLGNQVKDHHLNEEISQRLQELRLLERDFKDAERSVHSGVPSFEKLKAFLLKLTRLRSMEEEVRRFFIRQSELLTERHDQMKAETLHTRSQLDFFVDGFTNLRHRHDELLEKSTQMKAENEALQETLLAMTANESHFAEILHRTLLVQLKEKEELQCQLRGAREHIDQLQGKQRELEKLISRLKQERGDAQKDAACYKRQLQRVKKKAQLAASDDPDAVYFRQQATQLRAMLQSFFTLFRESIVRDTKSAKQAVSKEVLRTVHRLLQPPTTSPVARPLEREQETIPVPQPTTAVARVISKPAVASRDLDEIVRNIVLLGGKDGDAATVAQAMSQILRYAPIDLSAVLLELRAKSPFRTPTPTPTQDATTSPETLEPPELSIANYREPLRQHIERALVARNARGALFFNWDVTPQDVNQLVSLGYPIESIIDLKPPVVTAPLRPPMLAQSNTGAAAARSAVATPAKPVTSSSKTPGSPSRATPTSGSRASPSKPPASSSSPSRPGSRPGQQRAPDSKSSSTRAGSPAKSVAAPDVAKAAIPAVKPKPTPDRRAAFAAMPFLYSQLEPVQFPEERVGQVLDVLERRRQRHATPFVQWDDTTRELNETLAMWAEEVHMMVWVEQENRRPKKPGEDASAPSSRASNAPTPGLSSSSSRTATSTSSRTGTRAAAKPAGGASPTRGRGTTPSRSSSPSRAAAAGPSKRASAPSVSPKRNSSVSPPKRSVTKPAAPSPPKTSPGKATKSASSPSRRK